MRNLKKEEILIFFHFINLENLKSNYLFDKILKMKFLWRILAPILGLFLAEKFIPGVNITLIPGKSIYFGINFSQQWQMIIFLGFILGLMNLFLKPILNLISLPLRILTLGLFSLILNLVLVWLLDFIFPELKFLKFSSLLLTTAIIWILEVLLK